VFAVRHDLALHVLVHGGLKRRHEPGAHIHSVCAQGQGSEQPPPVGETAARDERNLQPVGCRGDQDQARNVVWTRMTGALEAFDADRIDPERLRLEHVPY
jgi:hypothetical protein